MWVVLVTTLAVVAAGNWIVAGSFVGNPAFTAAVAGAAIASCKVYLVYKYGRRDRNMIEAPNFNIAPDEDASGCYVVEISNPVPNSQDYESPYPVFSALDHDTAEEITKELRIATARIVNTLGTFHDYRSDVSTKLVFRHD
jgi:hypothetical protein